MPPARTRIVLHRAKYIHLLETVVVIIIFPFAVEIDDCDIVDRRRDMTVCAGQDDDTIIIKPDTNHNHQPLLSVDADTKRQLADSGRHRPTEDAKDSSTVINKTKHLIRFSNMNFICVARVRQH